MTRRGQVSIKHIIEVLAAVLILVIVSSVLIDLGRSLTTEQCLDYLYSQGYVAYANPQGTLYADRIVLSESPPITLTGNAKSWIEFRPELDFDIVKKNAVPLSYERGIFTGFELPIYNNDNQELIFEICIPNRWDGTSTVHIHLNVFLIDAQDDGDAFRLQIDYNHYDGGVDIVPNISTSIELETPTGTSAVFQSYYVHFDIPVGDMLVNDILAFRLRRIAATGETEITNNIVFNHAGVIFLCDKYGNPTAE